MLSVGPASRLVILTYNVPLIDTRLPDHHRDIYRHTRRPRCVGYDRGVLSALGCTGIIGGLPDRSLKQGQAGCTAWKPMPSHPLTLVVVKLSFRGAVLWSCSGGQKSRPAALRVTILATPLIAAISCITSPSRVICFFNILLIINPDPATKRLEVGSRT